MDVILDTCNGELVAYVVEPLSQAEPYITLRVENWRAEDFKALIELTHQSDLDGIKFRWGGK